MSFWWNVLFCVRLFARLKFVHCGPGEAHLTGSSRAQPLIRKATKDCEMTLFPFSLDPHAGLKSTGWDQGLAPAAAQAKQSHPPTEPRAAQPQKVHTPKLWERCETTGTLPLLTPGGPALWGSPYSFFSAVEVKNFKGESTLEAGREEEHKTASDWGAHGTQF